MPWTAGGQWERLHVIGLPEVAVAVPLALLSSVSSGIADFAGGMAARHVHILRVLAMTAPASWIVTVGLLPALGGVFTVSAVSWGLASGLASAAAFALLFQCLAIGPMGLLSPIAAVISAALPAGVGLASGERLGTAATMGVILAVVAVVLVSATPSVDRSRPSRRGVGYAVGAGTAISVQVVCLDRAPDASGLAPLVAAGAVSTLVALVLVLVVGVGPIGSRSPSGHRWAILAGVLGSFANIAFLAAVRSGELSIVAVVTALYPAGTVVLARSVLKERFSWTQVLGLTLAGGALLAISMG